MAIGRIHINVHSRGKGHTVAAAVAYRCGLALTCPRTGLEFDYSRRSDRQDIGAVGLTPGSGFDSPRALARAMENSEKRSNSRLLRDVQISLPAELHEGQRTILAQRFAAQLAERYGTVVAWAVHRPDKRGDARNHHSHLLVPCRRLDGSGQFGEKIRELDDQKTGPEEIAAIRRMWQDTANAALREAKLDVRIDTGKVAEPAPTLGAARTAIERRAYQERTGQKPAGLTAADLVEDGAVTSSGQRLARHHRERSRAPRRRRRRTREKRSHAVSAVSPAETRMDAEIGSKTRGGGAGVSSAPLPSPSLSPAEELADLDRKIAKLKRAVFETRLADEPPASEHVPQETLQSAPSAPTPGTAPNPPAGLCAALGVAQDALAPAPDAMAPATKPRRTRGEDWSVRTLAGAAAQQRTGEEPEPHPVETDRAEAKAALNAFLAQDPPSPPDAHAPDQGRDRGPHAPDTAPAESPREPEETETMPPDEIARQRRRAGAAVSAHAANHGRAPTAQEKNQAVEYLKGGYGKDGTPRPALGSAVDQCARAAFVGQPLAADPLAEACASTAAAAEARRMTIASVETFKREHPPQRGIISALEEWRRTLRPGLMKRILTVVVPLEVQHNRRRHPDQARRPPGPGPDFGI